MSQADERIFNYFDSLSPDTSWQELEDLPVRAPSDLQEGLRSLLSHLDRAGLQVFACDLTRPEFEIPVVKVQVPGLLRNPHLF